MMTMAKGMILVLSLLITSNTVAFKSPLHGSVARRATAKNFPFSSCYNTRLYISAGFGIDQDVYDTLGVSYDADMKKIKSAYRRLAKKYHPGKTHEF